MGEVPVWVPWAVKLRGIHITARAQVFTYPRQRMVGCFQRPQVIFIRASRRFMSQWAPYSTQCWGQRVSQNQQEGWHQLLPMDALYTLGTLDQELPMMTDILITHRPFMKPASHLQTAPSSRARGNLAPLQNQLPGHFPRPCQLDTPDTTAARDYTHPKRMPCSKLWKNVLCIFYYSPSAHQPPYPIICMAQGASKKNSIISLSSDTILRAQTPPEIYTRRKTQDMSCRRRSMHVSGRCCRRCWQTLFWSVIAQSYGLHISVEF